MSTARAAGFLLPPGAAARRAGDAALLILERAGAVDAAAVADVNASRAAQGQLGDAVLLVDLGGEALVVSVADAHVLQRLEGGPSLRARAAEMAGALRRERDRLNRRLRMPDHLFAFMEAVRCARCREDMVHALRRAAAPVVSAYAAIAYVAVSADPENALIPLADPQLAPSLASLPATTAAHFVRARLITRAETDTCTELASLAAVMHLTGAAQLLCTPVGNDGLLVLVERRRDRVLTAEDYDLLAALVRHAEGSLHSLHPLPAQLL